MFALSFPNRPTRVPMITDTIKETVTTYVQKGREFVSGAFEVVSERLHLRNGANGEAKNGAARTEASPKTQAAPAEEPVKAKKVESKVKETSKAAPAPKKKEKKLSEMTRAELYAVATDLKVRGRKNMRKAQLIDSIKEYRKK